MRPAIKIRNYATPVGEIILGSFGGSLCLCDWVDGRRKDESERRIKKFIAADFEISSSEIIDRAIVELDEFFAGKCREFDIPLLYTSSAFQCRVWELLRKVPYGRTISYLKLAQLAGNPKAVRAVAMAVAMNPISIFVPCHRVIGSDGSLTGYSGGIGVKARLLAIEHPADGELFGKF